MSPSTLRKSQLEPWIALIVGISSALIFITLWYSGVHIPWKVEPRLSYSFLESYYKLKIYLGPVLNYELDKFVFEEAKKQVKKSIQDSLNSGNFSYYEPFYNPNNNDLVVPLKKVTDYLNNKLSSLIRQETGYNVLFADCVKVKPNETSIHLSIICDVSANLTLKKKSSTLIHSIHRKKTIKFLVSRSYGVENENLQKFCNEVVDYIRNDLINDICYKNDTTVAWCNSGEIEGKRFLLDKEDFKIEVYVKLWKAYYKKGEICREFYINVTSKKIVFPKLFKKIKVTNLSYSIKC